MTYDQAVDFVHDTIPDGAGEAELAHAIQQAYERGAKLARDLIRVAGEPGKCRGCGAAIYWVKTANGKRAPYSTTGVSHFVDCPVSEQFRTRHSCYNSGPDTTQSTPRP